MDQQTFYPLRHCIQPMVRRVKEVVKKVGCFGFKVTTRSSLAWGHFKVRRLCAWRSRGKLHATDVKPATPQPQGCAPTAATAHVTLGKKAEEDTQARTMERTHSYRKRHQRTGVHIPHASSLLQCTDPCNTSSLYPPL